MEKIEATLRIIVAPDDVDILLNSLEPDNKGRVQTTKSGDQIEFRIINEKMSTITNVIDDILRCYNTFKNVVGE